MTELSAEKLAELRQIAGKATQGRWVFSPDDGSALDADVVFALDDAGEEVSTVTSWIDANDAEHIAAFDPPTVLALLDRIEEQQAELAEFREREAGQVYEYGIRYGDDKSIRRFMSREKAVYHLDAEFGDQLIRRVAARSVPAGEWVEVTDGDE